MLTKEQKIEDIRKQAIASNPEIVELQTGCHILWKTKGLPLGGLVLWENCAGNYLIRVEGTQATTTIKKSAIQKIIGRPIGLQDVLLAICKTKAGGLYAIDAHGTFVYNGEDSCCDWNLHKDSLDEQTEETVDFIYQLIV